MLSIVIFLLCINSSPSLSIEKLLPVAPLRYKVTSGASVKPVSVSVSVGSRSISSKEDLSISLALPPSLVLSRKVSLSLSLAIKKTRCLRDDSNLARDSVRGEHDIRRLQRDFAPDPCLELDFFLREAEKS